MTLDLRLSRVKKRPKRHPVIEIPDVVNSYPREVLIKLPLSSLEYTQLLIMGSDTGLDPQAVIRLAIDYYYSYRKMRNRRVARQFRPNLYPTQIIPPDKPLTKQKREIVQPPKIDTTPPKIPAILMRHLASVLPGNAITDTNHKPDGPKGATGG